ncbi:hypothetical protein CSUI_010026 [Cystoisospora suis]|uniref:Transmembrane protein n=1 Tax=Cystoisospora suis TaxID=483139 RepID=A0A2C6KI22_9APIC|nr:hypothetical protein CSUI_010026 [Cystoisospora suis]
MLFLLSLFSRSLVENEIEDERGHREERTEGDNRDTQSTCSDNIDASRRESSRPPVRKVSDTKLLYTYTGIFAVPIDGFVLIYGDTYVCVHTWVDVYL